MNHRQAMFALDELAAGELGSAQRAALREHLDGCAECRAWAEDYRLLTEALTFTESGHPSSEQLARHAVDPEALTAPEAAALSGHLAGCAECRHDLELTVAALAGARRAPVIAAPLRWLGDDPRAVVRRLALAAALILAVTLGLTLGDSPGGDARPDLILTRSDLDRSEMIETAGSIQAAAIVIQSGADVTLRAGHSVVLGNGFAVSSGATLRVENIEPGRDPLPTGGGSGNHVQSTQTEQRRSL